MRALIIAPPSPLQSSLTALMRTADQISAVALVKEASLVLSLVKDHQTDLVLLDFRICQAQTLLEQLNNRYPRTKTIILAGTVEQEREVKGADAVLIEGFPPSLPLTTIEVLLV